MAASYNTTDLQILKTLWSAERMSSREVHDALLKETGWSYSTTRTLLARMEDSLAAVATDAVRGLDTFDLLGAFPFTPMPSAIKIPSCVFERRRASSNRVVVQNPFEFLPQSGAWNPWSGLLGSGRCLPPGVGRWYPIEPTPPSWARSLRIAMATFKP